MQLHTLQPRTRPRRGQRIGRGGSRGTTAGRGTKGQKSRAGHKIRPAIRDIIKKLPKRRGYRFHSFRSKPAVLTLAVIERHFPVGSLLTPAELEAKRLIRRRSGRLPAVKILGNSVSKSYTFRGLVLSRGARAAVRAAGGTVA